MNTDERGYFGRLDLNKGRGGAGGFARRFRLRGCYRTAPSKCFGS